MMKRISSLILAAAVAVGVLARISDLGKRSFWYDELYCVVGAATSTSIAQLRQAWMDVDGHPPGFMLALYAWFKLVPANWRASTQRVIEQHSAGDRVFVIGADPAIAPDVYLRNGQVEDYFYCRTVPFYAFYFNRLGAPQLAAELRVLPMESDGLTSVLLGLRAHTSFVLAPHHTRIKDDALKRLKRAGFEVDDTPMFSTHLYRIRVHD
jgi:hypothetical protein